MSEIVRIAVLLTWLMFIAGLHAGSLSPARVYVQSATPDGGIEFGEVIPCAEVWLQAGTGPAPICVGIVVVVRGASL